MKTFIEYLQEQDDKVEFIRSLLSEEKIPFEDVKRISSKRFAILIDGSSRDRSDTLRLVEELLSEDGAKYSDSPKISSAGNVRIQDLMVLCKPKNMQGMMSSGIRNELNFTNTIQCVLDEFGRSDIIFMENGSPRFKARGVHSAEMTGRVTNKRSKSDVDLKGDKEYKISLKMSNSEFWESADNFFGTKANTLLKKLLDEGKIRLEEKNGIYSVKPNVAVQASPKEAKEVVFGNDIKRGSGLILKSDFSEKDISYNVHKKEIYVNSGRVITDISDLKRDERVWFLIRNDRTRNSKAVGFPGIRVVAAKEVRINNQVLRIK